MLMQPRISVSALSSSRALLPSATTSDDPLWERIARGESLGRPVADALRQRLLPPARPEYPFADLAAVPGVTGVASSMVRCEGRYRRLVDTLLGRTVVVDDLAVAQRFIRRGLAHAVATVDGVLLRPVGAVSGVFLIGYGAFRFLAEFTREPDSFLGLLGLGLSMGQWLSLPMIVAGILMLRWAQRQPTPGQA